MNLSSFGTFLADVLVTNAKVFEQNLLQANYKKENAFQNAIDIHTASAKYQTLMGIAAEIPKIITEFYNKDDSSSSSYTNSSEK